MTSPERTGKTYPHAAEDQKREIHGFSGHYSAGRVIRVGEILFQVQGVLESCFILAFAQGEKAPGYEFEYERIYEIGDKISIRGMLAPPRVDASSRHVQLVIDAPRDMPINRINFRTERTP